MNTLAIRRNNGQGARMNNTSFFQAIQYQCYRIAIQLGGTMARELEKYCHSFKNTKIVQDPVLGLKMSIDLCFISTNFGLITYYLVGMVDPRIPTFWKL
jgi:hypothetical protein